MNSWKWEKLWFCIKNIFCFKKRSRC